MTKHDMGREEKKAVRPGEGRTAKGVMSKST